MIIINSTETRFGYSVKSSIKSNAMQLTCEVKTFINHMLKEEPEMMNAVISELMPAITESTYNMDPDKFRMYLGILEDKL